MRAFASSARRPPSTFASAASPSLGTLPELSRGAWPHDPGRRHRKRASAGARRGSARSERCRSPRAGSAPCKRGEPDARHRGRRRRGCDPRNAADRRGIDPPRCDPCDLSAAHGRRRPARRGSVTARFHRAHPQPPPARVAALLRGHRSRPRAESTFGFRVQSFEAVPGAGDPRGRLRHSGDADHQRRGGGEGIHRARLG